MSASRWRRASKLLVVNRKGETEPLELDRITNRNSDCCAPIRDRGGNLIARGLPLDPTSLTIEVISNYRSHFENGCLRTSYIDALVVDHLVNTGSNSVLRLALAARLILSNIHHTTSDTFVGALEAISEAQCGRLDVRLIDFARRHSKRIEEIVDHSRDYRLDYVGVRTLINSYLSVRPAKGAVDDGGAGFAVTYFRSQHGEEIIERPQHCYMRVALWLGLWFLDCPASALSSAYLTHLRAEETLPDPYDDTPETRERFVLAFAERVYSALSLGEMTFGSPFFFNAGMRKGRVASCFLMQVGDSNESIHYTLAQVAAGMGGGGGVGIGWDGVRADGAYIGGSGGRSTGIPSWWREYKPVRKYVNQGGGKRPGAIAMYHPFWHPDTPKLLIMPRDSSELTASGENTPRIQTGLSVENCYFDLFERDAEIFMLPPEKHPELAVLTGDEWERRFYELQEHYAQLEPEELRPPRVRVRDIEASFFRTLAEKGVPYRFLRTNANAQCNLSVPEAEPPLVVNCSNLCAEILIPTSPAHPEKPGAVEGETGVCVLATVNVMPFLERHQVRPNQAADDDQDDETLYGPPARANGTDFAGIIETAGLAAAALDIAIDLMWFSPFMKGAIRSLSRHRTIGVGIMGLAGGMQALGLEFETPEAVRFSADVALAVYVGACESSANMAVCCGPYPSMRDTRDAKGNRVLHSVEKGLLQPDVSAQLGFAAPTWAQDAGAAVRAQVTPDRLAALRTMLRTTGQRNGLLTSGQPTASNSLINGVTPGCDVPNALVFTRKSSAGNFLVTSYELYDEARRRDMDADELMQRVMKNDGSLAGLDGVPEDMAALFRTAFEIRPLSMVAHAAARQPFITQSQSTNLNMARFSMMDVYEAHRAGARLGLCTFYYVYSRAGTSAMATTEQKRSRDRLQAPAQETPPAQETVAPISCPLDGSCDSCQG